VAYLAPDTDGVLNVWVRTLGKQDDQLLTTENQRPVIQYYWQGDSQHILYLQDQLGDENYHLFQIDLATKNTRDLTPWRDVAAQLVDVNGDFPNEVLVGLNLRDRRLHDVYRIDLQSGAVRLDTQNPGDVTAWGVDHQMQVRTATVFLPEGGQEIRVRDDRKAPWRTLTRWGAGESFGNVVGFTPDNKQVQLLSSVGANAARLLQVDPATGKSETLAEDPNFDASLVLRNPRTHELDAAAFHRTRHEWTAIDPSFRPHLEALTKIRDGDFYDISRDRADRKWIVTLWLDNGPAYSYLYDRDTGTASLLFSDRPDLEQYVLAPVQPMSFAARDGTALHGYVTLPVGVAPNHLPTVLLVHGGPWMRDLWVFDPFVQLLANRGYAVLQVNFRGSCGYGKAHLTAGDREWAGRMHDDLLDAKEWAVQQGYADPARVAIMGGSYGGYATLVGLTYTPEAFAAGVDLCGPSNLVTFLNNPPPYWAPCLPLLHQRLGHPESERAYLESRSPLFRAGKIVRPLLIAQGANDVRVTQAESDQIVAAMRKNKLPVEYLVFPDEGHGFARPENNLKFMAAVEEFLARHLGGRFEPAAEHEKVDGLRN
jgi:dipeptidyl aminopeptidase/acylaminoacyl peptidase